MLARIRSKIASLFSTPKRRAVVTAVAVAGLVCGSGISIYIGGGAPTTSGLTGTLQSCTVQSYTNGTAGVTDASITCAGAIPSSWVADNHSASPQVVGSAVVDTTNPTVIPNQANPVVAPSIASISGNTIYLEQSQVDGNSVITGFTPAAMTMTSANVGDVIRAGACTGYSPNHGCPVYSQFANSAGMGASAVAAWLPPAYFTGYDSPITGSGSPTEQVSTTGGVGGDANTFAADGAEDVTWDSAKIANGQYNGIDSFPNEGTFAYSGIVDNYPTLTQSYSAQMPCCQLAKERSAYGSSGSNTHFWGWEMTEDYFTQPGGSVHSDQEELSIQNSYGSTGVIGTVTQNVHPIQITATGTTASPTLTINTVISQHLNVTTGSQVVDATNPTYLSSGTYVVTSPDTTPGSITLSANPVHNISGDTLDIASGWNYGPTANDVGPIGAGTATATSCTASGVTPASCTFPVSAFTDPTTSMGEVAQDDPVSDTTNGGNITAGSTTYGTTQTGTRVTSINQSTGVVGFSQSLNGNAAGDTISFGLLWFIQDGAQNHNLNGTCSTTFPNCGQLVMHVGCDQSDLPNVPNPTGTIPLKGIVNWLETHAAPQSTGLVSSVDTGTSTWGNAPDPCANPGTGTNNETPGPWCGVSSANGGPPSNICTTSIIQDPVLPYTSGGGWANYGYIVPSSFVSALSQGWEILGTESTQVTLHLTNIGVHAS